MKPKKNTDDQTTVSMKKNTDDEPTVAMSDSRGKPSPVNNEELTLIHSYWRSGSAALKRQAVSRYAKLMNVSAQGAEAALAEWAHQSDPRK